MASGAKAPEGSRAGGMTVVFRATYGAALALKARVALRNEMWSTARDAAQVVISLGVYELYPDYR